MSDTIDVARRALPLDLYRLACEYLPHGPALRPQEPHIVVYEVLNDGKTWLRSYRVRDAYVVGPHDRVLARCHEQDDYLAVWTRELRGRALGVHIYSLGCCFYSDTRPIHYPFFVGRA